MGAGFICTVLISIAGIVVVGSVRAAGARFIMVGVHTDFGVLGAWNLEVCRELWTVTFLKTSIRCRGVSGIVFGIGQKGRSKNGLMRLWRCLGWILRRIRKRGLDNS